MCAFIYFKEDVGNDLFRTIAKERLLTMPRFRSRYDHLEGGFYELDVETEIDLDYHVKVVDDVQDIEQVRLDYVGDVYKHFEFDAEKPLWQLVYFPKLADGRAMLLTKIAHIIGDGVSQVFPASPWMLSNDSSCMFRSRFCIVSLIRLKRKARRQLLQCADQ